MKLSSFQRYFRSYLIILLAFIFLSLISYEIYRSTNLIEPSKKKKKKIAAAGEAIQTLANELEQVKKSNQSLTTQNNTLTNNNKTLTSTVDQQVIQIDALDKTNVNLNDIIEDKDNTIESNKAATVKLQNELGQVKNDKMQIQDDLNTTQEKLAFYETAYNSMVSGV